MGSARRRYARAGRASRWARRSEHVGRHGVLAAWWLVCQLVRLVAIGCEQLAALVAGSLAARRRLTQLALLAAALATAVLVWRAHRDRDDRPLDDVEALARVIRSEIGTAPPQHRLHVAWATRNLAGERGQSIVDMACSPCGRQERGRPVSTRQRATDVDRMLAREVLAAPCELDPTGGATHFIDPVLQDALARARAPGYAGNTYVIVARRWRTRYRWAPYYRLGRTLEMWGPARRARRSPSCGPG